MSFEQTQLKPVLLDFWSSYDLPIEHQDTNSVEVETKQKSSKVFAESITHQSPSDFIEDPQILEDRGFFKALDFLDKVQLNYNSWNSIDHTYAKQINSYEDNPSDTELASSESNMESVQTAMTGISPDPQEIAMNNKPEAKTAIKRKSITDDNSSTISHNVDSTSTCLLSDTALAISDSNTELTSDTESVQISKTDISPSPQEITINSKHVTKIAIKRKSTPELSPRCLRSKLNSSVTLLEGNKEDIMKSINSGASKIEINNLYALETKTINACFKLKWLIKD
jgi:hypothetical protein